MHVTLYIIRPASFEFVHDVTHNASVLQTTSELIEATSQKDANTARRYVNKSSLKKEKVCPGYNHGEVRYLE